MSQTMAVKGEDKGRSSSKFVTGSVKLLSLNKSKAGFKSVPSHTRRATGKSQADHGTVKFYYLL